MAIWSWQILTGRSSGTVIPPPLVRGGQQGSSKHGSQVIMPPLVRGAQVSLKGNVRINEALVYILSSHCCFLTAYKTKLMGINYPSNWTYDPLCTSLCLSVLFALMLRTSLPCPPLPLSAMSPSPVPSLSLSWLAHLCVSTADPGSPPAAAAAAAAVCLWSFRTPPTAAGPQDLNPCRPGPERHRPVRPHWNCE